MLGQHARTEARASGRKGARLETMSHAHGKVFLNGEVIAHFEYDGTVDVAISHLCDSAEEVQSTWRDKNWMECADTGTHSHVPVTLFTTYGGGFYWPGIVCLRCRAIVSRTSPEFGVPGAGDGEPREFVDIPGLVKQPSVHKVTLGERDG